MITSSRRRFVSSAAAVCSTTVCSTAPWVTSGWAKSPPSETISLGFIGVGNHGLGYNLKSFLQLDDCRPIAVCDVFASRQKAAAATVNAHYGNQDCSRYGDFRELLARDDIDAVAISTPDHWHVPLSILGLRAGKDVFCEKPTLTIAEGRTLVETVKQHDAVFQTGLEDRSVAQYHKLAEAVRNGAIGELKTIHCGLPFKKDHVFPLEEEAPVPADLNYVMWQGPAPEMPYTPTRTHRNCWRQIQMYSGGTLTDWGAHIMDTANVANFAEKSGPVEVSGTGRVPEQALNSIALEFDLTYRFANEVAMHVKSDGVYLRFEGSEGWVGNKGWRGGLEAHDRSVFRNTWPDNKIWSLPPSEHRNFVDCVKSRQPTTYTAEDLQRLSSTMHIGNIALQLGRRLAWDPQSEAFVDDAEANALRSRPARTDWENA